MENQENQQEPTTNKTSPALWVSIILVVIVLAVGAYFVFIQEDTTNTNNANITVNTNTDVNENVNEVSNTNIETNTNVLVNTNTVTNTNVDTSGWEKYENNDYGFSFQYPNDWYSQKFDIDDGRTILTIEFGDDNISSRWDPDTVFSVSVQTLKLLNGFSESDIAEEFEINISNSTASIINGYQALTYYGTAGSRNISGILVLFNENNNQVIHIIAFDTEYTSEIQEIFNSLKITK